MRFTVTSDDGVEVEFECADTLFSRWVCGEILEGKTYPALPFLEDVREILDVGANCGAASCYFGRRFPDATVHAFEPASEPRAYLERNVAGFPNVRVHPIGFNNVDEVVPLYKGGQDSIMGSVLQRGVNTEEHEDVQLRHGGAWVAEQGIDRIDILKVDVEGLEMEVLASLAELVPQVQCLYVEYDSRQARRDIAALVDDTHELYTGVWFLDQGESIYVRKDLAALDAATDHLKHLLASGRTAQQP